MPGPNDAGLVVDLIAALEVIVAEHGDRATYAVAHQSAYPLRLEILGITATRGLADDAIGDDIETPADRQTAEAELPTVWIVTEPPNAHDVRPYAPAGLWEAVDTLAGLV